jgi:hypothetical protein
LTGSVAPALAGSPPPSSVPTENSVETLALEWFAKMRTGQIDRTQLAADYSAQLTDDAVQAMSRYLKEYEYGASPTGAQVLNLPVRSNSPESVWTSVQTCTRLA